MSYTISKRRSCSLKHLLTSASQGIISVGYLNLCLFQNACLTSLSVTSSRMSSRSAISAADRLFSRLVPAALTAVHACLNRETWSFKRAPCSVLSDAAKSPNWLSSMKKKRKSSRLSIGESMKSVKIFSSILKSSTRALNVSFLLLFCTGWTAIAMDTYELTQRIMYQQR